MFETVLIILLALIAAISGAISIIMATESPRRISQEWLIVFFFGCFSIYLFMLLYGVLYI